MVKAYIPVPSCSKRLCPRVGGESPPTKKRRGTRGSEDEGAGKKTNETKVNEQEVGRYFTKLRRDELRVKGHKSLDKVPKRVTSVQAF